jgi:hypothetical protein
MVNSAQTWAKRDFYHKIVRLNTVALVCSMFSFRSSGTTPNDLLRVSGGFAWNGIRLVFSAMLLCQVHAHAQSDSGPRPPCGTEPTPPYPGLDSAPIVKVWSRSAFGQDWKPPACIGWPAIGFSTLVTTVARFSYTAGAESLLLHVSAISELAGIRYWSTTHQAWQTLIVDAHTLTGPTGNQRRRDYAADELREGRVLYFEQADNLSGKAVYRMHIAEATAVRLVFDVENVSTMRYLLVPLFHPGEMQSIFFLDRESENVWRYYSIVRNGKEASSLTAGHDSSSINRAIAFYRFFAGIPTDREPPAAR